LLPCIRQLVVAAGFSLAFGHAFGACKIGLVAELPVETADNRLVTDGEINGQSIKVLIDTGSSFSFIWDDAAQQLQLPLHDLPGVTVYGVGGEGKSYQTLIRKIRIGTFHADDLSMVVIGVRHPRPTNAPALVLGDDLFSRFSTEFDLAHGKIRLLRTDGCKPDEVGYWTTTYSLGDLERSDEPQIRSRVLVNGQAVDALLDTGTRRSAITRRAAERAGVTPWLTGPATGKLGGIGSEREETWIGTFDSFALGDESVRHVALRISDLFRAARKYETGSRVAHEVDGLPTMLIGCDFFLAHRILVLSKQRKLVFTYNGGPIFQAQRDEPAAAESAPHP
jgi:hypothetical protein